MAEIVIKEQPKVKVRPMMYKNPKTVEDDERELAELEASLNTAQEQEEAEAEQEIAEHDANLSAEEKTFKKRYGDLRRHSQKQKEEYESRLSKLEEQLTKASTDSIQLPKSPDEIKAWATEYPDVAAIVETIASTKAQEQQQHLEERMKQIDEMQANATRDKAEAELLKLHPDFAEIRDDDAFHDWADEQPAWVQKALYENDADARSAGRAIDLYKADMGLTKSGKKKGRPASSDKDAAMDVSVRSQTRLPKSKGTIRESDIAKMNDREYERNAEEIALAMEEGRFVYDISGR
jgi:DNA repair exonuclease SbcCD ATPase subunit